MSSPQMYTPSPISIAPGAINKVRELVAEEENPNLKFRVYVTGGGCSGFQYGFAFEEDTADDDTLITRDGVTLVVDPMSYPYLLGSVVNYEEGLQGARFTVQNPNANSTCGCGASFSI